MSVMISQNLPIEVSRLSANDDRRVWEFLAKFIKNPTSPGIRLERIIIAKNKKQKLWSGKITDSLRAIIRQDSNNNWTIIYAGKHDDAYKIAAKKEKIKSATSAQFIDDPELEAEVKELEKSYQKYGLFEENTYEIQDIEEIEKMRHAPLASWLVFLHPEQQKYATISSKGPIKITGAAGTGKTVISLHRARYLARQNKQVLFACLDQTFCKYIKRNLQILCTPQELQKITVDTVYNQAQKIVNLAEFPLRAVDNKEIKRLIKNFCQNRYSTLPPDSLLKEWNQVISAQNITTWDEYRVAARHGRGYPLNQEKRHAVWQILEKVLFTLYARGDADWQGICCLAIKVVFSKKVNSHFDAVIIDEVQDFQPQEILFLKALAGSGNDCLTLVGDAGQKIYPGGFNLKQLGVDVVGRSYNLQINYRTTQQIRIFADAVLGNQNEVLNDGQEKHYISQDIFRGIEPILNGFDTQKQEVEYITQQVLDLIETGMEPEEIALFARTQRRLIPIQESLENRGIPCYLFGSKDNYATVALNLAKIHQVKGLEFKVVFIVDVSDKYFPFAGAVNLQAPLAEIAEAKALEKRLLYVGITRARDELFISWVGQPSRFLQEIISQKKLAAVV
ncbi:MAG: 3'-5' exonuclease [Microcoleaceae cyanobacterium]